MLLFVYGTLRRDSSHPMARFLATRAEWVGRGTVAARLYHLGRYPGIVPPERDEDRVTGDVYRLPADAEDLLAALDRYENGESPLPAFFERAVAPVRLENGQEEPAWLYWFRGPVDSRQLVCDGDYGRYLK